ncbi:hypothetical protein JCM17823_05500 [Halorubrum gandharaense]
MNPPVVPDDALDGWAVVAETTETPFSVGPISVVAHTRRYEPTDTPAPRPFFFASRLAITPRTRPNGALTRLVERGAREGFRSTLADRGIDDLSRGDRQTLRIDDPEASEATLTTFHGVLRPDAGTTESAGDAVAQPVPVLALLATWTTHATDEYLLAGGAVPAGEADDPEAGRRRLLQQIRSVRAE